MTKLDEIINIFQFQSGLCIGKEQYDKAVMLFKQSLKALLEEAIFKRDGTTINVIDGVMYMKIDEIKQNIAKVFEGEK